MRWIAPKLKSRGGVAGERRRVNLPQRACASCRVVRRHTRRRICAFNVEGIVDIAEGDSMRPPTGLSIRRCHGIIADGKRGRINSKESVNSCDDACIDIGRERDPLKVGVCQQFAVARNRRIILGSCRAGSIANLIHMEDIEASVAIQVRPDLIVGRNAIDMQGLRASLDPRDEGLGVRIVNPHEIVARVCYKGILSDLSLVTHKHCVAPAHCRVVCDGNRLDDAARCRIDEVQTSRLCPNIKKASDIAILLVANVGSV